METFATREEATAAGFRRCGTSTFHKHRGCRLFGRDVSGYPHFGYDYAIGAGADEFEPAFDHDTPGAERAKLVQEIRFSNASPQRISILTGGLYNGNYYSTVWSKTQLTETISEFVAAVDGILAMTDEQIQASAARRRAVLDAEREHHMRLNAQQMGLTWDEYLEYDAAPHAKRHDVLERIRARHRDAEQALWA